MRRFSTSILASVCALWAVHKASRMTVLRVNDVKDELSKGKVLAT